jgi:SsrA-binding protein
MPADIASNRRAFHNFQIMEKLEAGIALTGTEIKSIRSGLANLNNSFARIEGNEAYLYDLDIQPYERASHTQHDAKRVRKLLLHRAEILRLLEASTVKGQTLVALRLYWKDRRVKLELGIGKGKTHADKREDLKEKAVKRETSREMSDFNRRRG